MSFEFPTGQVYILNGDNYLGTDGENVIVGGTPVVWSVEFGEGDTADPATKCIISYLGPDATKFTLPCLSVVDQPEPSDSYNMVIKSRYTTDRPCQRYTLQDRTNPGTPPVAQARLQSSADASFSTTKQSNLNVAATANSLSADQIWKFIPTT